MKSNIFDLIFMVPNASSESQDASSLKDVSAFSNRATSQQSTPLTRSTAFEGAMI